MRQHTGFSLQWIREVPYLLPFGQNISDHRRGLRINETGAFIWETLDTEHSRQELLDAVLSHYEVPAAQQDAVIRDTDDFISMLATYGMVDAEFSEALAPDCCASNETYLQIGGRKLCLLGPKDFLAPEFAPFEVAQAKTVDCTISIHTNPPVSVENGTLLLRSRELFVCERSLDYLFLFPTAPQILEGSVTKDGKAAHFYLCPPVKDSLKQDLFHAIRLVFLYLGQLHGLFALHSASILYNGKAWLFSGHSGMGKSTHTNLWKEHCDTPVLNGDLNLLELTEQGAVVRGIPWCGTSGISTTKTYPLGGIVLLGRAEIDRVEELSCDEKALLVAQRLISPSWTLEQLARSLAFTSALTSRIPVCRLKCTKSTAAVETMRQWIDMQDS
jgi:hypothetical protein